MSDTPPQIARIRLVATGSGPKPRSGEFIQSLRLETLPGWKSAPEAKRGALLTYLKTHAKAIKDSELRRGIDRHGKRLKKVKPESREGKYLPSENGPPLTPRREGSRIRTQLDASEGKAHITLWWKKGFGRIVAYHARGAGRLPVRDVVGLTPAGLERLRGIARTWWAGQDQPAKVSSRPRSPKKKDVDKRPRPE